MKLTSRRLAQSTEIELSMTSMIDVVFLLLIFFMTTSSFVRTERDLNAGITLEESASSAANELERAIVDVGKSGSGAGFVYRIGAQELESEVELVDTLKKGFPRKTDGAFVRVAAEAPFRMTAAAIQACKTAGFLMVTYVPLNEASQ